MESNRNNPQDIRPPRRTAAQAGQRGVFSDFTARPARLQQPGTSVPTKIQVTNAFSGPIKSPTPETEPIQPAETLETPDAPVAGKRSKEPHETAHSGWVGWVVFVVLTLLALSSLLPGKIFENFPGSSVSESTGDQTIGCIDDLKNVTTSTSYTSKRGFPIVYSDATNTTLSATCDGAAKSASAGHTSVFSPLAAVLNVLAAAVVALLVAKIWRKLFGPKKHSR